MIEVEVLQADVTKLELYAERVLNGGGGTM